MCQFLHLEADLLDGRDYEAWLGLLDEAIQYRMPIARNVRRDQVGREYTATGQTAWFDEGITTLRQRVAQFKTGIHWARNPLRASRTWSRTSGSWPSTRRTMEAGSCECAHVFW